MRWVPISYLSLAKASKEATKAGGQDGSHRHSLSDVSLWEAGAAWEARQTEEPPSSAPLPSLCQRKTPRLPANLETPRKASCPPADLCPTHADG